MTGQDRYLKLGEVRVRYRDEGAGNGPPLVLLHGIGRSLEDWDELTPLLAHRHRVIRPDLLGFGRSDKPDVPYSLPGLARFVCAFLDALGVWQVTPVGSSLGGAVSLQFLAMYPERVSKLVLVGSAAFGAEVTLGLRLATVPRLGEWLTQPSRRGAERTLHTVFHDQKFVTPERIERDHELAQLPGAGRAFLSVARALGTWRGVRPDWREALHGRLQHVQVPTLVSWGRHDQILPVGHLDDARRLLPHASFRVFEDSGHFPQIEAAQAFGAVVNSFLQQVEAVPEGVH
jgi:pimeloyl-ACP methyl ester carboxylesterase